MRAALALVLALVPALPACSTQEPVATPSTRAAEARPRVDSALCDDLREVVSARAAAATTGTTAATAVRAAAERVLVQLGATPAAPEDVVSALREIEGGAGPDDAVDATVAAFVEQECGGA